jgi:hypothetical protein
MSFVGPLKLPSLLIALVMLTGVGPSFFSPVFADAPTAESIDEVIALEKKVLALGYKSDAKAMAPLVADDFVMILPEGRQTKTEILESMGKAEPIDNAPQAANLKAVGLGPDHVLVTYTVKDLTGGADSVIWTSSIWGRRDGKWLNVFSQITYGAPSP